MAPKLLHLQGMRGVAICSVVLFHYFPSRFPNAYLGVDLFFVLSGYLMSMMLSRDESISPSVLLEFLYRRLKRIAPLYYFTILITTVSLFFLPFSNIAPNLTSSWNAIFLQTNLIRSGDMDYFQKLGMTRDMFTHTWSLCLEMQFYAIFPFIWMLQKNFSDFSRLCIIYIICALSIAYYVLADEFLSFNSLFARIWQFLLGNVVFLMKKGDQEDHSNDYNLLSEDVEKSRHDIQEKFTTSNFFSAECFITSMSLSLLIFISVFTHRLPENYARFTTTVTSSILIHFGRHFPLLECSLIVFLGAISYSWYLVHWPLVAAQKLLNFEGPLEMVYGALLSLLLAVAVHFVVEKRYLTWDKEAIIISIVTLLLCNLVLIHALQEYVRQPVDSRLVFKIGQMTKDELKKYNIRVSDNDQLQLRMPNCTYIPEMNTWFGYCEYQSANPKRNNTILIVGNSWAANVASIVFDECGDYAGKLAVQTMDSCEVLYLTKPVAHLKTRCGEEYTADVAQIQPDQLFIIARAVDFANPRGTQEMAVVVRYAARRLKIFETFVRDKIFILNIFTSFTGKIAEILNKAIDTGIPPKYVEIRENQMGTTAARLAIKRIVKNCSKCVLYDYEPYFEFNGTVLPYDPKTFASFMTIGKHLTPLGLERIRPVYRDLCSKL